MFHRFASTLAVLLAVSAGAAFAQQTPAVPRTWSVSVQSGFASTFQLNLGGYFGDGPDWQNRVAANLNNLFKDGDGLCLYGWSTADLRTGAPNWQAGLTYKNRVLRNRHHALTLGGGVQRWLFPSVKSGAQDWLASGSLNYTTAIKKIPVIVNQDSWTLLRSPLPAGTQLHTQIYTQRVLYKREGFQLLLRHGPQHTYSWGFWGANGNRVVRYAGSLAAVWKNTTLEAGYRQQFGLQDGIPNNRYWSFQLTRQMVQPFHSR
jgi:hypothetical protein